MAEDDDDETFGDFAFAPFQSSSKHGANPSAAANDDWGDFLSSTQQSNPADPSVQGNRGPDTSAPVKRRGALPLSIFGEEEEEEEEKGSSGIAWSFDQRNAGDFNSKSQSLNIADLYNRSPQIKPETNSVGAAASVDGEAYLRSNQQASGSAVSELKSVDSNRRGSGDQNQLTNKSGDGGIGFRLHPQDTSRNENLFGSWSKEFYGVSSNLNTSPPNLQMLNDDYGDDEWEFKDALTDKTDNNEVSNRNTHSSGNVLDSSKSHDANGTSNGTVDFFSSPTESVDYFAASKGFSTAPMEMDFFGNQMGGTSPNGWTSDSKSNIEQTKMDSILNHSPGVGSGEFDEDFGEFAAAPAEMEPKPQEAFTNDLFVLSKGVAPTSDGKMQVDFMVPEVSKRNVNSSGSVFGESNGPIDFFATSADPVHFFATSSCVSSTSKEVDLFGFQSTSLNGFSSYANSLKDTQDHTPDFIPAEADEDFGDFTTAAAETGPEVGVDLMIDEAAERRADSFTSVSDSKKSHDLFEMSNGSTNFFGASTESLDFFAPSGISITSHEVDLSGLQTSSAISNGFSPEKSTPIEQNGVNGTLNHSSDFRDIDFEDDFGEFAAAATQTGPQTVEKDTESNNQKGAIPLSIFGSDEAEHNEPQSGGSSDVHDVLKVQSSSNQRYSQTPAAALSINDLISSLYSQAEPASLMNALDKPTKTELGLSNAVSSSSLEHLEDSMWDFEDAPEIRVDSEGYLNSIGDTPLNVSSQLELKSHLDFYCQLKEELCFVIKHHIENLRHAGDSAFLSGEDTRAASLDNEFELVCKELEQLKFPFEGSNLQDDPLGESLKKFVGVLLEPQFQILESEYHLSNKLLLAERDERSAMELIRHTTTMLKILTMGTSEERKAHISTWFEIISVCAQELKCGALIWNEAVEKQVQSHLLSEPQGKKYVLGLGEIYRVVAVLEASAKLYKPWILLDAVDLPAIYSPLEECHTVWSSSGFEEALSSVLSPVDPVSSLMSVKHIRGLDALTLQNHFHAKLEPLCQLSLLPADMTPGVKMVTWENRQCFVTLANLWANMISRNPPNLPHLSIP